MGDFLDSLPFLSPEQRASLRAQDLDTADAFGHLTITDALGKVLATPTDVLMAPPFGLTLGKASRLLAAAKGEAPAAPAQPPATLVVNMAEPPDLRTRIERALLLAEQDPSTIGALADLGVDLVVLGEHGKAWPAATIAARAHAATGAPLGKTWQGAKIVSVHALAAPTVWCSPRTGRPLQAGADEVTGTEWAALGLAGLRVAAFGYEQGMFDGMSESSVLDVIRQAGELRAKIERRMAALDVKPEDMDPKVVWKAQPARVLRDNAPTESPRSGPARGGSLVANISTLLLACFSASEMRRFLRYLPGGADIVGSLPGENASPAALSFAAAEHLIRHGRVNRDLRNALVQERPGRATDIDKVFDAAGV
jgi:hypothetical protein